jgi:dTDP-glucose 4,6-dehydratase
MREGRRYLVAGGAGFIGSNFAGHILRREPEAMVRVLDRLTYSGTLASLEEYAPTARLEFVKGDICDRAVVRAALEGVDVLVNFAAEVAVDRAILSADSFLRTGVSGVHSLLEESRRHGGITRFLQVSTDEVYGSIDQGTCRETSPVRPRNPYSATKLAGEMLAISYFETYGVPVVVTRACNTYGPKAHPEKVIPLFITNLIDGRPMPVFGDGRQSRDWLYVEDHCRALHTVLDRGENGNIYNVGAGQECTNLDLAQRVLRALGGDDGLIKFVKDRPGHDRRYSVNAEKLAALGWQPSYDLERGLRETVAWYCENEAWWRPLKEGLGRRYAEGFWGVRA